MRAARITLWAVVALAALSARSAFAQRNYNVYSVDQLIRNAQRAPTVDTFLSNIYRNVQTQSPASFGGASNEGRFRDLAQKPFANVQRTPTVSPYLNLSADLPDFGRYQTLVRPIVQQEKLNQRQSREIGRLDQQVQSLESGAGGGVNPYGNPELRPTGHAATFFNRSYYYPR